MQPAACERWRTNVQPAACERWRTSWCLSPCLGIKRSHNQPVSELRRHGVEESGGSEPANLPPLQTQPEVAPPMGEAGWVICCHPNSALVRTFATGNDDADTRVLKNHFGPRLRCSACNEHQSRDAWGNPHAPAVSCADGFEPLEPSCSRRMMALLRCRPQRVLVHLCLCL